MATPTDVLQVLATRGAQLALDLRRALGADVYYVLGCLDEGAYVRGEWVVKQGCRLRRYHLTERGRARLLEPEGALCLQA